MYQIKNLSYSEAIKAIEHYLFMVSNIDVNDLTTLELTMIRLCSKNPPNKRVGAENQINNASYER